MDQATGSEWDDTNRCECDDYGHAATIADFRIPEHPHIGIGFCPVCQHYGDDCTGEKS